MPSAFLSIDDLNFPEGKNPGVLIRAWSSVSAPLEVRGFTRHNTIIEGVTPTTDRVLTDREFRVSELPYYISVRATAGGVRRGHTYVRLLLRMAGVSVVLLGARYLSDEIDLTWPAGQFEDMISGPGVLRSFAGTNPAANAEISETVPTNAYWKSVVLNFALTTDANVANRNVIVILDDGTNVLYQSPSGPNQAASVTRTYLVCFGERADDTAFDASNFARIYIPTRYLPLLQGYRIRTSTVNLQTGDDYGAPRVRAEELLQE